MTTLKDKKVIKKISKATTDIKTDNNIELRYEMIYDKIGILRNSEEIWKKNLEDIKKYIDENNKRPSSEDKNKNIKYLGNWILHQKQNYLSHQQIMMNNDIRYIWENFINDDKYKKYFLSNEQEWNNNLEKVKKHIDENIVTTREISKEEYMRLFDEDNDYLKNWDIAQKMQYINTVKYNDEE